MCIFRTDRVEFINIDGTNSSTAALKKSLPQGYKLSPLLFSLFINDFRAPSFCYFRSFGFRPWPIFVQTVFVQTVWFS